MTILATPVLTLGLSLPALAETSDAASPQGKGVQEERTSTDVEPLIRLRVVAPTPNRPAALFPLYLGLGGLSAADAGLTLWGTGQGATEANPAMRGVARHPFGLFGVKAVSSAATILLTERVWRDHPRRAVWTMVGINFANALIVWHNSRVVANLQRAQ
jgi:hypothetical protein